MADASISFHHNHLISENPSACATWYAEKLGGRIAGGEKALSAPSIVVTFKGMILIIRARNDGENVLAKDKLEWGIDHFGFLIEGDFDGYCNALKEKGVKFTREPMDINPTMRIAFIEGPDGVSIELVHNK